MPKETNILNPKMEIEGMSWAVYWEDEGLPSPLSRHLTRAFVHVINYRTYLIVGDSSKIEGYGPKNFDKLMFKLAKFYFPDWIGFNKQRCSYDAELGNRILRIQKVAEWRFKKMLDDETY
ncbi:hypothetical protein [Aquimarina litoralis]|uniref:hypothetical protein n=1 Tax=Aquimarina litoralis TaxID=584605 RepID=UPI001C584768|nr:hypothetical protein [Aquimarina litoralis]MBW1299034.1 hypothetical protein [Aquimarina litoralis]